MDEADAKARHAGSFGRAADAYERGRPSYPAEAIDWLLPTGIMRVLDLGAGTGKLTRDLVARGLDVVAVEPSDGMRAQLLRGLPGVTVLAGTAESIPLDSASVGAVLVAQAWHWVDPFRAVPEVARVLRPGGRLGLLWNCREESDGWTRNLGGILRSLGVMEDHSEDPPVGPPFNSVERRDLHWTNPVTTEALIDLVASRSYFIVRQPAEQAAVLAEVRQSIAREPGFADGGRVGMPYVTRCSRADLL